MRRSPMALRSGRRPGRVKFQEAGPAGEGRRLDPVGDLDPRPGDVTDKKNAGTAHNPAWSGVPALEWSQ